MMKKPITILAIVLMMSVSIMVQAEEPDLAEITEHYNLLEVEEYIELVEQEFDAPLTVDDHDVEVFLELEVSDGFLTENSAFERYDVDELLSSTVEPVLQSPFEIAWKWGLSNFTLYSDPDKTDEFNLPSSQLESPLGSTTTEEDLYVAAAELTGAVANVDIYTEFGITGGNVDSFRETSVTAEELEDAIALDLAGYYVSGGASVGVGRWKVGVEAGYEQNTMTGNGKQAGVGSSDNSLLIGNATSGSQTTASSGGAGPLAEDPFQLVYFQGTADRSVTKKLGVKVGALCFAVPEQFVTDFQGKDMSGYGFEFFGDINYQIAKSIKYSLYMDYALTDKDFENDNMYQILNRFEFNF